MFKAYGGDKPVRLFRANPRGAVFNPNRAANGEAQREFAGMWFTNDPNKISWYAHNYRAGNPELPVDLQYVDIPESQLSKFMAKGKVPDNFDFEPNEDFLIPLNYPRQSVELPTGRNLETINKINKINEELAVQDTELYASIKQYVPEARERYGLVGNPNITDDEIAQALYKQALELGEGTGATYPNGEPRLLFRGDTSDYTTLRPQISPEELAGKRGTMDNSLGTLFLGEYPGTYPDRFDAVGASRYLNGKAFNPITDEWEWRASGTGKGSPETPSSYRMFFNMGHRGHYQGFVKDASTTEYPNRLNAFVVRTPNVRNATREISVLDDDVLLIGGRNGKFGSYKGTSYEVDPTDYTLHNTKTGENFGEVTSGDALAERQAMADHYSQVLKDAEANQQGLLVSGRGVNGHPLREEHSSYTYFALPNFNLQGAKHLLPYDLMLPRNWNSQIIFKKQGGKIK